MKLAAVAGLGAGLYIMAKASQAEAPRMALAAGALLSGVSGIALLRDAAVRTGAWTSEGGLGGAVDGGVDQDREETNRLIAEAEASRLAQLEAERARARITADDLWNPPAGGPGWYQEPPPIIAAAREVYTALVNAPAGVLTITGAALLAVGFSDTGTGMQFLRWVGAATLLGSGLIAARRAIAGV